MIPEDKFGNKIFGKTYDTMVQYGIILEQCGYFESKRKPNLFYRKISDGIFFADMRGTNQIKIWKDPRPLFYFKNNLNTPYWKRNRLMEEEIKRMENMKCHIRLSYEESDIDEWFDRYESASPDFQEDMRINQDKTENGFCKECGLDFQDSGYYCSETCREYARKKALARYLNSLPFCSVCGKKIVAYRETRKKLEDTFGLDLKSKGVEHHISYKDDKTIVVCASCHSKIHHSKESSYASFKPESKRPDTKREYKFGTCVKCGGKAKISATDECVCYRCRHSVQCKYCGKLTTSIYMTCSDCKQKWRAKKKRRLVPTGWELK